MQSPPEIRKRRRNLFRCALLAISLLFACTAAEVAVRLIGEQDVDGNFSFRGRHVGRQIPPVTAIAETLDEYRHTDETRMIYNAETGWSPRPHISTHGGNYRYNSVGIRSEPKEYSRQPAEGILRVALFGDSFTHGDDVHFDNTWGAQLEEMLTGKGIHAEVINFGVSAYGMDQAYLRWQTFGKQYSPHVVLFGFQAENVNRNVNLLRAFYAGGTGIPFSKPRFVLEADDSLRLINSPTLPLDEIPHVMADMESWNLSKYEMFYDRRRLRPRWWHHSRAVSLAAAMLTEEPPAQRIRPFQLDSEPANVTLAMLRDFQSEVERDNARFYIVHLPTESDLARLLKNRGCAYQQLLDEVAERHTVIDPQPALLKSARSDSLEALFQRHYSPEGNRIIAEVIAQFLTQNNARRSAPRPDSE